MSIMLCCGKDTSNTILYKKKSTIDLTLQVEGPSFMFFHIENMEA